VIYQIFVILAVFYLTPTGILYKRERVPVALFSSDDPNRSGHLPWRIISLGNGEYADIGFYSFHFLGIYFLDGAIRSTLTVPTFF
jgi:hypothetical protein